MNELKMIAIATALAAMSAVAFAQQSGQQGVQSGSQMNTQRGAGQGTQMDAGQQSGGQGVQPGTAGAEIQQGAATGAQGRQGNRRVVGRVVDDQDIQIKGIGQKHKLVRIEQNGRRIIVDLGAQDRQPQIDLEQGDILFVSGRAGRINGKPVLVAQWAAEVFPMGQGVAAGSQGSGQ